MKLQIPKYFLINDTINKICLSAKALSTRVLDLLTSWTSYANGFLY